MTDKVTIEIDGRACEATPGEMIIDVADREDIAIPRFCYHKKLSIAANCRMCLVEAEQGGRPFPKPVPACATPVVAGMKVLTRSAKALDAQKSTMEFLLINHPLDCPICDQGGECELQDVAMGYGGDVSRYAEGKRVVKDEDLGPLIATDMTRCIHCTRCVRFGAEIAGVRELGATGRGEDMRIGTYVEQAVTHELAGNIIDLCPVGALTSKPYRYTARAWELTQAEGVAPHDSLGSNLHLHLRGNQVMRVHPRENEAVNETWISDRDRFSYQGLYSEDRLRTPLVKNNGSWRAAEWPEALALVAARLREISGRDPDLLATLSAPNATLEELYLLQKITRGLGSAHIDHRLRQTDFRGDAADPLFPWLGTTVSELERQQALLLIGTNLRQEQPLLAHRIRKAVLEGAGVTLVNPFEIELTFPATQVVNNPTGMLGDLAAIAKALRKRGSGPIKDLLAGVTPDDTHKAVAERLKEADESLVLLGNLATAHPDYSLVKALAHMIGEAAGATLGFLPEAANSVGACLAGALPQGLPGAKPAPEGGLPVSELLARPRSAYLLWGLEPAYDSADPAALNAALGQAEFVVACTAYRCPSLESVAEVMLPIAGFAETSGTYVNAEGRWQVFRGAVAPPGDARPGWKVLRVLGNQLGLEGFDYVATPEIAAELQALCAGLQPSNKLRGDLKVEASAPGEGMIRVGDVPAYALDALVRRATALQQAHGNPGLWAALNGTEAERLGLAEGAAVNVKQNGAVTEARVVVDERIPNGCTRIPAGVPGSESLGSQYGTVILEKA